MVRKAVHSHRFVIGIYIQKSTGRLYVVTNLNITESNIISDLKRRDKDMSYVP
jgi:transposase-like protein